MGIKQDKRPSVPEYRKSLDLELGIQVTSLHDQREENFTPPLIYKYLHLYYLSAMISLCFFLLSNR